MSQRIQRVNKLIKEQVSQLILKEIDFGGTLVTITEVDTAADLSQSKIKISVLPTEKTEQVLQILKKNIFQLQQTLNKKLTMRIVPKIIFEIDQAEAKAQRIEEILGQMKKD
jgi:ribosome-binding factor A